MSEPGEAPRLIDVFAAKAGYYAEAGRHDRAEQELRKALALEPDDPELHFRLSLALSYQDRTAEAEQEAREVLRLLPDEPYGRIHLAGLLMERGAHVESERVLLEALRLDPMAAHGFLAYGLLMFKTRRLEKAEKLLRRCLQLNPELTAAHAYLGMVLADANRSAEARAVGEVGLGLDPDDATGHALLGRSLLLAGRPFQARRLLREAARLAPGNQVYVDLYLSADRACRWIYLPFYYWSLVTDRLPGKQFLVWCLMAAAVHVMRVMGVSKDVIGWYVVGMLVFALYTFLAIPLTHLWIRLRPAK